MRHLYCVTVTYNPDIKTLTQTIHSISQNGANIIVVDNASTNIDEISQLIDKYPCARLVKLDCNRGIAAAQNKGITQSIDEGAEWIWLSDQDTCYPENYIELMEKTIKSIETKNLYAVFGPAYIDTNRNTVQPFVTQNIFTQKTLPANKLQEVSHIIASGMIIPSWAIKKVGLMQENLFIDWVDLEWCFRARKIHGLKIGGCGNVIIRHTLGDMFVSILGKKISIRSPFRHYFIIRNGIALSLYSESLKPNQRIEIISKSLAWSIIIPIIAPSKKTDHLKATMLGLIHGFTNRLGVKQK